MIDAFFGLRALHGRFRDLLGTSAFALTPAQAQALLLLQRAEGPVLARDLGQAAGCAPSTISRTLSILRRRELVGDADEADDDGRARPLALTAAGEALAQQVLDAFEELATQHPTAPWNALASLGAAP